jgi:uncharacterized protein (TIGR04255 family)
MLAVQFEPLAGFRNAHLGVFWKSLGSEWPEINDAPPIEPQFERFGAEGWVTPGVQLRLLQNVPTRSLIQNSISDRMIQLQNGRLGYNWLGAAGGDYPRYKTIRPEFLKLQDRLSRFLNDQPKPLGELQPNQWEVTYVNHIPKGSVWNSLNDWSRVFRLPPFGLDQPEVLNLQSMACTWSSEIMPQRGRLHVQLQLGVQPGPDSNKEVIALTLTGRGPIGQKGMALEAGLDLGHETIVRAFRELTTDAAHEYWGLDHENA